MVGDRMGEIEIHDDVGGSLDVGVEDIVDREIEEKHNSSVNGKGRVISMWRLLGAKPPSKDIIGASMDR